MCWMKPYKSKLSVPKLSMCSIALRKVHSTSLSFIIVVVMELTKKMDAKYNLDYQSKDNKSQFAMAYLKTTLSFSTHPF